MEKSRLSTEELSRLPILQGEENEYGEYDCYAIDKPDSYQNRRIKHCTCDSCGKERLYVWESCSYFYTLDGYDSLSYRECAFCAGKTPWDWAKRKVNKWNKSRSKSRELKALINKCGRDFTRKQRIEIYNRLIKIQKGE